VAKVKRIVMSSYWRLVVTVRHLFMRSSWLLVARLNVPLIFIIFPTCQFYQKSL